MNEQTVRTFGALAVSAIIAAAAWTFFATPATQVMTPDGLVYIDNAAAGKRFGVVVTFVVLGVVFGAIWGWWAEARLRDIGPAIVLVYLVSLTLAAVIMWQAGAALGPPDPQSLEHLKSGARIRQSLALDSYAPLISWPIAGIASLMLATYWHTPSADRSADDHDNTAEAHQTASGNDEI